MKDIEKKEIEEMSYETMLRQWRFAPSGSPTFSGMRGNFFAQVMYRKRDELPHAEQVKASKNVGWEK